MVVFENVSLRRGTRTVLDNTSFRIERHERVVILGGSGVGKTTLLKLVLGLIRPDTGRIIVDGQDLTDKPEEELRRIRVKFMIVFQEGALFDSLNVKDNVAFYLRERGRIDEDEVDRRVHAILKRVGLEYAIDRMPEELSGGMIRRVAIARSLAAGEPAMFLYDEPTGDLDPLSADTVIELIQSLATDTRGFIVVTHQILHALRLGRRFMFLSEGTIHFDGGKDELLATPQPEVREFVGDFYTEAYHRGVTAEGAMLHHA
jgi:phospholipid/cholesterol/gamma-HCH transport system ATP-binding protein